MKKQRLQRKIEELEKKWDRLSEILDKLDHERILETRPEEKIRLEHKIDEIKAERQQVEKELNDLEPELLSKKEDVSSTPTEGEKPDAETRRLTTDKAEPERPETEPEIEKVDFEQLEQEERIRPEHKITEITPERREIEKEKRTKRLRLRTKMLLLAGVSVLLVAGVILFISIIKPMPTIRLRSERLTVSEEEAQEVFGLISRKFDWGTGWVPRTYIENDYEAQDDVVIDHTTGLMWQKSGSDKFLTYQEAQDYIIKKLNGQRFAGHNDWRLPTVEELMSLLEPEKQSNDLYINPIFEKRAWCWSADRRSSDAAWNVDFNDGHVRLSPVTWRGYVRCVRS